MMQYYKFFVIMKLTLLTVKYKLTIMPVTCLENIQNYRHELKKLFLLRIYYVPCVGYSLNLVEECSVDKCIDFVNFFARLYAFFSVSMHRWSILLKHVRTTLKSLSSTRWSCRAITALAANYLELYIIHSSII